MESRSLRSSSAAVPRQPFILLAFFVTIFTSAFLLFQVQPIVSKSILPWFGGSPAVWTTCMLFFQVTLLVGYSYAHATSMYLNPRVQIGLHICLFVAAFAFLPILPSAEFKPMGDESNPTNQILLLLLHVVGLPFFLLATTAPLLQFWWQRHGNGSPYRLYSISNAGSLLALLSYPFLIEPRIGVRQQIHLWSILFAAFAVLMIGLSIATIRRSAVADTRVKRNSEGRDREFEGQNWQIFALWFFLSACGSMLLLAMTNHLSQNVAVVPFLWIAPLGLYLLSFIVAFGDERLYHREFFGAAMMCSFLLCGYLYQRDVIDNFYSILAIHLVAMFAGSMICHGELYRLRPDASHLTLFYLTVSAGGAAGGLFVGIVAPGIFLSLVEYPLVLVGCWAIWLVCGHRREEARTRWQYLRMVSLVLFLVLCWFVSQGVLKRNSGALFAKRGFYGVLSVQSGTTEGERTLDLWHGTIRHGAQYLDTAKQYEPTTYYGRESGIGRVMDHTADREERRIGILGLGVGTMVAYCKEDDEFRVYEIDPNVVEIATNPEVFTFWSLLNHRHARGSILLGDARLSLERELAEEKRNFDVLIVDVFQGDAIPVHLLTREAFTVYMGHLSDDGILAIHITNRHVNLLPIVQSLAQDTSLEVAYAGVKSPISEWALLANRKTLEGLMAAYSREVLPLQPLRETILWTDDYSNIFRVLR